MEVTPRLEIASFEGKNYRYGQYEFICKLFVTIYQEESTIAWLRPKGATILNTDLEKAYFIVIFATNNSRIISSIHNKYGSFLIDIRNFHKKLNKYQAEESGFDGSSVLQEHEEYYQGIYQEVFNDLEAYSTGMVRSSESGWFYSEPDRSEYRDCEKYIDKSWD